HSFPTRRSSDLGGALTFQARLGFDTLAVNQSILHMLISNCCRARGDAARDVISGLEIRLGHSPGHGRWRFFLLFSVALAGCRGDFSGQPYRERYIDLRSGSTTGSGGGPKASGDYKPTTSSGSTIFSTALSASAFRTISA